MVRLMNLVAIALFIIMAVILVKYQLVCEVTIDGEKLGYITDKEKFEQSVSDMINKEEENKLYTTIANMPKYNLVFVEKTEEAKEEEVLAKIQERSETTYKLYAVTINGKKKATIANLEEAEKLVKDLNKKYKKETDTKIGIVEVITTDNKKGVKTVKKAKADIIKNLDKQAKNTVTTSSKATVTTRSAVNTIKTASTSKNNTTSSSVKVATNSNKSENNQSVKKTESTNKKTTTTKSTKNTKVASLNGVKLTVKPVSGVITSRFGSRESIRNHGHSGLDIGAPKGRKIKAAASGTVIFAGYSGGYGNVVKISHGSGIKTYYAHCSKLYVKKGQKVSAGDVIAAVGSTGNSTGNHLHFEVVKNGVSVNPQNYLYK